MYAGKEMVPPGCLSPGASLRVADLLGAEPGSVAV